MSHFEKKYIISLRISVEILWDSDKFNYLLNSCGPIVKVAARFFYLESLMHSSVNEFLMHASY